MPLLAVSHFDESHEAQYVEYAQRQDFGGIVMSTAIETPRLRMLVEQSPCPIVLINRYLRAIDTDVVYMDTYRAGYIAAAHFLELGHTRILCINGDGRSSLGADKLSGFQDAQRDAGLDNIEPVVWEGDMDVESGLAFGRTFASQPRQCTAVFCFNEALATGFIEAVLDAGLSIPDDVSVMCMTPEPLTVRGRIHVTCVVNNAELFGETAAQMLIDRMNGLDVAPRKVMYSPQLCVRESVKDLRGAADGAED